VAIARLQEILDILAIKAFVTPSGLAFGAR
jgi:hypothetical protein